MTDVNHHITTIASKTSRKKMTFSLPVNLLGHIRQCCLPPLACVDNKIDKVFFSAKPSNGQCPSQEYGTSGVFCKSEGAW